MIVVRYKQRYKKRKLTVTGHAGAGPEGHDLVCAGASTLVLTVIGALTVNGIKYHSDIRDGYAEVRCIDPAAASVYNTVMCGFETLRTMYPELIDVVY